MTMLRLTSRQRVALGGTLRELADFAAAALVFGQFVGQQPASWTLTLAGVTIWSALVALALKLLGER
jgi:hypothetical protein